MAKQAPEAPNRPQPREPENHSVNDRLCKVCQVKLSSYNPGPNCWQHTIGYPWRGPTAKPKF